MENISQTVKQLIAGGDTDKAIEELLQKLQGNSNDLLNKVILISSQYRILKKQNIGLPLPSTELTRINMSILETVEELDKESKLLSAIFQAQTPQASGAPAQADSNANIYLDYGDDYLMKFEYDLAKEAYSKALEYNAHEEAAKFGLEVCSVLQAKPDEFITLETIRNQVLMLLKRAPQNLPLLMSLANIEWYSDDAEEAVRICEQVITLNPDYGPAYLQLGYFWQGKGDIPKALEYYEKSLSFDKKYSLAHNNLGYIYRMQKRFDESVYHLDKAIKLSFSLLGLLNLSDSYRYKGDFKSSLHLHTVAERFIAEHETIPDRFLLGEWMYNYMPLAANPDVEKFHVTLQSKEQKFSMLHFGMALNHALLDNAAEATRHMDQAIALDVYKVLPNYFCNQMQSVVEVLGLQAENEAFKWMSGIYAKLQQLI